MLLSFKLGLSFCLVTAVKDSLAILGPIGTDNPSPPGGSVTSNQPPSSFFQGHSPPYPTNDWWVGFGAGNGDSICAGPFPYATSLSAKGIRFGISKSRDFDGTSIHQRHQMDWTASFVEHSGKTVDHKALSWDSQSVTVQYFTGSSNLTSYLVPGSPYMTFEYSGATPRFTSGQGLITSFSGQSIAEGRSATASGTQFVVINKAGSYIIYSLSGPLSLTATAASGSGIVTASSPFTGILRLVKLNNPNHKILLDQHYTVYPKGVTTDYSFYGTEAVMSFTWSVVGNQNDLLMLTWPHHRVAMISPNFPATSSLSYLTTKGYMYPALGSRWFMIYALPSITWNAPRLPDSSCNSALVAGLEYEIAQLPKVAAPGDFYYFGGHVAKVSRFALIAEIYGRNDLVNTVVTYLKAMYQFWFNPGSRTQAAYETAWGGIINRAGYNNTYVDFGNGYYNDHHFHYGYFLAAAAVIAKFDSAWKDEHKTMIDYFLRDIVNPSRDDPYFPVTRCRDFFAGHSWASGVANGAGTRDQESVGEAVNGYYGALLWAIATENISVANYARMLLAQEQQAAKMYWHLYPDASSTDRDNPYPEEAFRKLITVGNVEDWQAGAWLFWGTQKVQIAAIQILPVTPVNEYMYDAKWAQNVVNYAANELNNPSISDDWKSVIYLAYSMANSSDAASRSAALTAWGSGNSFSNQLYFLSTRPDASGICTSTNSNPTGRFVIQSLTNGLFVANSAIPNLVASATAQSAAAVFQFGFAPNAGTIRHVASKKYVTADQSGTITLAASRASPSAWEVFVVRERSDGSYSIMAASNKKYVVVDTNNRLKNNGSTEASGTGFRLIPV